MLSLVQKLNTVEGMYVSLCSTILEVSVGSIIDFVNITG